MKHVLWTLFYVAFFAALWALFLGKVPAADVVYVHRWTSIMTFAYYFFDAFFLIAVLGMAVINNGLKEGKNPPPLNETQKASLLKVVNPPVWMYIYRYLCFYPTVLLVGIGLGYYGLLVGMLIDITLFQTFKSQVQTTKELMAGGK